MIIDSLFHIFPGVLASAVPQLRPQLPSSGSLENYTLMTMPVVPVCVCVFACVRWCKPEGAAGSVCSCY